MTWDEWIVKNRRALEEDGTPFERIFVEVVLSHVPSLSPGSVSAQTPFRDLAGGNRRIDFTIAEGEFVRIALEVDGYDKTGTGSGQSRDEFKKWSYRELSMTAAGWVPLRFANGLIQEKPEDLRESIELQLKMQRSVEAAIIAGGEQAKRATEERRQLQAAAEAARRGEEAARAKLRELQAQRLDTESTYLSDADSGRLHELQDEIDVLNNELLEEKRRREEAEEENQGMKKSVIAIAVVAVVAIVAVVVAFAFGGGSDTKSETTPPFGNDPEIFVRCDDATPVDELSDADEGTLVSAKGEVSGARRIDDANPRIYLSLGDDYPDQELTVLIWGDEAENWTTDPEVKYDDREVAVAGRLETYEGDLQIVANSPNDIVICS